jgi:hypothetical protein
MKVEHASDQCRSYKQVNTPEKLGQLTDSSLLGLGISDQGDRKGVLDAVEKAGYRAQAVEIAGQAERKKRKASRAKQSSERAAKEEGDIKDLKNGDSPRSEVCALNGNWRARSVMARDHFSDEAFGVAPEEAQNQQHKE